MKRKEREPPKKRLPKPVKKYDPSEAELERTAKGRQKSGKAQALHYFAARFQDAIHVPASIHGNGVFLDALQVVKNIREIKDELYGDFVYAFEKLLKFYLQQPTVVACFVLFDIPTLVPKTKQQEQQKRKTTIFEDVKVQPQDLEFHRSKPMPLHFQSLMDDRVGFRIPFIEWLISELLRSEEMDQWKAQGKWYALSGPSNILRTSSGDSYVLNHGEADIQAFYLAHYFGFKDIEFVTTDTDTMYYGLLHTMWDDCRVIWSYHKRFLTWCFARGEPPKRIWPEWEDSRMNVSRFAELLKLREMMPENVVVAALVGGSDYTTGNLNLTHEKVFNALFSYPRFIGPLVTKEREIDKAAVRRLVTCAFFAAAYAGRKTKDGSKKVKDRPTVDVRFLHYGDLFNVLAGKEMAKHLITEKTLELRILQLEHYWKVMRSMHDPEPSEYNPLDYGYHKVNGIYERMY